MMKLRRYLSGVAAAAIVATSSVTMGSLAWGLQCGYVGEDDGYSNKATWTNCGNAPEKLTVHDTYADAEMCVSPGPTTIDANPNLGAVRGADRIGTC